MSIVPDDLRYTDEHEWVRLADEQPEGGPVVVRIGITDYAQDSLGDIVFVQLPPLGTAVGAGDELGVIESTKSVSDLFAPVGGSVVTRNDAVESSPELLNSDPYGDGWIVELQIEDPAELDRLLDAAAYAALLDQ